jgi:bacteriorhodopsin
MSQVKKSRRSNLEAIGLGEYNLVYNAFSFAIAVMGAATVFAFFGRSQVAPAYKTALTLSGLVTLIAFYHYFRIFNSWDASFTVVSGQIKPTGIQFNDAYRYVDWLLTVPLLLVELILVMRLTPAETFARATKLGVLAAIMVALGYPGEISADNTTRWIWWGMAMIPFLVIVYDLFVGLGESISKQPIQARGLVSAARTLTVVSWCFYPVVFVFPMIGLTGGAAVTAVQVGYTVADIVAKAVFGVLIYAIAMRKSESESHGADKLITAGA